MLSAPTPIEVAMHTVSSRPYRATHAAHRRAHHHTTPTMATTHTAHRAITHRDHTTSTMHTQGMPARPTATTARAGRETVKGGVPRLRGSLPLIHHFANILYRFPVKKVPKVARSVNPVSGKCRDLRGFNRNMGKSVNFMSIYSERGKE